MRIGELSRRTGVSPRALRYYEEQGLLAPARRPSGYREFEERDVATVRRIQILLSAGLGTSAIAEIVPCADDPDVVLVGKCPELLDGIARERERITATIEELTAARDILDSLVGRPLQVTRRSPAEPCRPGSGPPPARTRSPRRRPAPPR